jgi:hypothetical protein
MTIGEANDLLMYWKQQPPVHIAFNAFVRGMAGDTASDAPSAAIKPTEADLLQFVAAANS